ncbi:hypothetical protein [Aquisphaera insulae]|uniref:hypothetical protein n=1 Tax=Aquisphaera insulae TaxID=2712864 RepID=UPI0013EC2C37|nr:hypothetical protein [Aquisphaera insulae]
MATQILNRRSRRRVRPVESDSSNSRGADLIISLRPTCPGCGESLELLQPDMSRYQAILGSCSQCPAWYLIDMESGKIVDLHLCEHLLSEEFVTIPAKTSVSR